MAVSQSGATWGGLWDKLEKEIQDEKDSIDYVNPLNKYKRTKFHFRTRDGGQDCESYCDAYLTEAYKAFQINPL